MQKFKVNQKNGQLNIQYKLKSAQSISEQDLAVFSGRLIRGLMHPGVEGKKIVYTAPTSTSLKYYLPKGIDKNTFFVIFAQVNELVKRIEKYGLKMQNLVLEQEYVFINSTTKELQFIYQPINGLETSGTNISTFLMALIQSTVITSGEPTDFLKFAYNFIGSMQVYSTQKVEQYIANLYPQALRQIVREQTVSSGKLTDKRYHVERSGTGEKIVLNGTRGRNTSLLTAEQTDDTSLLQEIDVMEPQGQAQMQTDYYNATISTGYAPQQAAPFQPSPVNPLSMIAEEDTTFLTQQQMQEQFSQEPDFQQGVYQQPGYQAMPFEEEATSLLENDPSNFAPGIAMPLEEEEATSLLTQEQESVDTGAASIFPTAEQNSINPGMAPAFAEEEPTSLLTEAQDDFQPNSAPAQQPPAAFAVSQSGFAPVQPQPAQQEPFSGPLATPVSAVTVAPQYEQQPSGYVANTGFPPVPQEQHPPYNPYMYEEEDDEGATALLTEESEGTKLVQSNVPDYPFLLRLSTYDRVEIQKNMLRIGKEKAKVDFFVPNNNAVSRVHADIIIRENRFFILDHGTTNGTFVNGTHIPPKMEYEIHEGDSIMLANEAFEFHVK